MPVSILETQAWNLLDFHGAVNSGIPLLADMTSYPPSMTVTGGPLIPFSTAFAELNLFDRLKKANLRPIPLAPLGSVGLSSVELAIRLFSGPIILVGIDFGYMPGEKSRKRHFRPSVAAYNSESHGSVSGIPCIGAQAENHGPRCSKKALSYGRCS